MRDHAVARAIVIRPRVLLFDEPLSNLDAKLRVQMRGEIRDLQRRLGITTVYVTHDQEEAMAISDRIAVMNKGVIVQIGDAEALYRAPVSAFVARFIGRANLIDAAVTAVQPDRVDLIIGGRPHSIAMARADFSPGAAVIVVARPEAIEIIPPNENELAGVVWLGLTWARRPSTLVEVAGTLLQVVRFNPARTERLDPGAPVAIRLPADGVQLLPKEDP